MLGFCVGFYMFIVVDIRYLILCVAHMGGLFHFIGCISALNIIIIDMMPMQVAWIDDIGPI